MASPSSSSSRRLSPSPRSPVFTPIQELEKETEEEEEEEEPETKQAQSSSSSSATATADAFPYKHEPTPLHQKKSTTTPNNINYNSSISVLCNKCRPSSRDKISVVPFDSSKSPSNPKAILHSLLFSLTRAGKSPKPTPTPSSSSSTSTSNLGADDSRYWKMTAAELSRKLIHATRKRDEALVESSRLRNSVVDLESKLNRLESYCLELKSSLDSHLRPPAPTTGPTIAFAAESRFLSSVSLARSAVRNLARSYRAAAGGSPLVHVEASLNRVFYGDMEKIDESKTLDPAGRCEQNLAACESVRGITWEDVLTKGTRHYSEGLSRFCDRKMSEVVGTLGWGRAWPESLLQAFFSAAKGVWMVGLLARSVHPAVPLLGVEGGARFDKDYMEDAVAGERVRRLTPVSVRMVVAPGFYVGAGVVKCKVLCAYSNNSEGDSNMS